MIFAACYAALLLTHLPLLRLPYFWDETGYYIPAARDLLVSGDLIPHSTLSNAHPPLVMAALALAWKLLGYSPLTTRCVMLLFAAFGLTGVFALAEQIANRAVATASLVCVLLYPVFFAQSSLAHVDLAAAAFTFWALLFYLRRRSALTAFFFTMAVLAKETALITPLMLLGWEMVCPARFAPLAYGAEVAAAKNGRHGSGVSWWLLLPALPLAAWFGYHYLRTGYVFGNPEFFRYNVGATLTPLHILFAGLRRLWQIIGYMNLYMLTLAAALAMFFPALRDAGKERPRIVIPVQMVFAAVVLAHLVTFSLIGGAALARYMLTAVPLVIIICVSTIWRRMHGWAFLMAIVCAGFVAGWFVNPPYVFAPEDNLAYRDFVLLHQSAAERIASRYPTARVLTAWPASDELRKPWLGYVPSAHQVLQIENFTREELEAASRNVDFDVALVFSTKVEPNHPLPLPEFWKRAQEKYFGYHKDVAPEIAAQILGGRIVYREQRGGQWAAVIEVAQTRDAKLF